MDRGLRRRIATIALATLLMVVASGGAALGAIRYAAPTAEGAANCSSATNACTLAAAVSGSNQGDTVMLAGAQGSYGTAGSPLTSTITDPAPDAPGVIEGTPGQPRPVIYTNADVGFELTGTVSVLGQNLATSVSDLDIEELGTSLPTGLSVQGNVDHVVVHSPSSAYDACEPLGLPPPQTEVISDSLCVAGGLNATALGTASTGSGTPQPTNITLRNDTLYATGSGSRGISFSTGFGVMISVGATNVIARGAMDDVSANQFSGGGVSIALDHSNYSIVSQGTGTTITPAGTGSNQTAEPSFTNASAGDFREAARSPTIDAGVTNAANGATDVDGNPRTIGRSTDIGAYEAAEAPTLVPTPPTAIGPNKATLNISVNPNFSATSVLAYLGTSTGRETPFPTKSAGAGIAPVTLAFSAAALKPDTTYHYHFVATNALGTSAGIESAFTSPAATGTVRIPRKAIVHHAEARVRLSCSRASTCAGTLDLKGAGKAAFSIAAERTVTVVVKLSRSTRHALAKSRYHGLKVLASVHRSDGGAAIRAKVELVL